jgi:hypothetical protein
LGGSRGDSGADFFHQGSPDGDFETISMRKFRLTQKRPSEDGRVFFSLKAFQRRKVVTQG